MSNPNVAPAHGDAAPVPAPSAAPGAAVAPSSAAAPSPAPARAARPQYRLTVTRTLWVTPGLVRVYFSGAPADVYGDRPVTDSYMKLYFATGPEPLPLPINLGLLRAAGGEEGLPVQRTYSMRSFDAVSGEMAIEFVVHGTEGVAGPWAAQAAPGQEIIATAPGGAYAPHPEAEWHLLLGDESALPAIASALEALPADATGHALIEVEDAAHEARLTAPEGVSVRWLHRGGADAGTTTLLAEALEALDWPAGIPHVFAHGEREAMKALRPILKAREVPRERLSLSGYWAFGRSEDRFQAEKREPIGKIL